MTRDDGFDVFLSYAHSDGGAAAELNGWLCAQGLHTFFDRRELRPGFLGSPRSKTQLAGPTPSPVYEFLEAERIKYAIRLPATCKKGSGIC